MTYNPSVVRKVLDGVLCLAELLQVRGPRDTTLQERRGRHAGECGGSGEGWSEFGDGEKKEKRTEKG